MNFNITILIVAFIIAAIAGIFVIPMLRKLKVGQSEREDGPQSHLNKQGTPTMGGIIMIIAVVISVAITFIYNQEIAKKIIPIALVLLIHWDGDIANEFFPYSVLIWSNSTKLKSTL